MLTGEIPMMIDWNEYQQQLTAGIGDMAKLSPDTVRGYMTLGAANAKTSKLGEKTRQLISLAVAVTTRCDGCIVFHTEAALKAGATREEIAEALGVAVSMNAGVALVYSTRVLDAFAAKTQSTHGD
jgi:AhpD family alkylhydroperoxidase